MKQLDAANMSALIQ